MKEKRITILLDDLKFLIKVFLIPIAVITVLVLALLMVWAAQERGVVSNCKNGCSALGHTYLKFETITSKQYTCWCTTESDKLIQIW